jgi:phosphoribosylformylglycinamidine cyclo-ligase
MTRYRDAGVDVPRADRLKESLRTRVAATWGSAVRPLDRGFAGVIAWPGSETLLLAATMDGVGTKLHVALAMGRVGDAAADLVYHGADDLLVHGARPLAFLDYIAQARLDSDVVLAAVTGMSRACAEVGAALLGGETAEMPDTYLPGVVDVAGCLIGIVEPSHLIDGRATRPGDRLLGLASNGLHTNGFSLARRVLSDSGLGLDGALPGDTGVTIGEALLAPHRWYGPALAPLLQGGAIHALAHVTGGGIVANLARVIPMGCRARVRADSFERPALLRWIVEAGRVPEDDARSALNLGIGMVVVCDRERSGEMREALERSGERVFEIGDVAPGDRGAEWAEPS